MHRLDHDFLGPPVLSELGGAAGLRARLHSPTTTVQELEGEQAPEAGDLEQGRTLPTYRELARMLEPFLEPFRWGFLARQSPSVEQDLRRWWRRFLNFHGCHLLPVRYNSGSFQEDIP